MRVSKFIRLFKKKREAQVKEDCVESLLVHQSFNFFYFLFLFSATFSTQRYHHRKKAHKKNIRTKSEKNEKIL
jgi:hypothetical protein